jgi:hypothetical protein
MYAFQRDRWLLAGFCFLVCGARFVGAFLLPIPSVTTDITRWNQVSFRTDQLPRMKIRLFLVEEDEDQVQQQQVFGAGAMDAAKSVSQDADLLASLERRQKALQLGIGKRFVTRTQKGFLNVHYEPTDPYDTNNIVSQLQEGEIVTSTGPKRGFWIPHDRGGWSIAKFGGFTWLEPIEE